MSRGRFRAGLVGGLVLMILSPDGVAAASVVGTASAIPAPAGTDLSAPTLDGISCYGVGACTAVGGGNSDSPSLISTESAGRWTSTVAPVPAGDFTDHVTLQHVACASTGYCVAIGVDAVGTGLSPVMDEEIDGGWSSVTIPLPPDEIVGGADAVLAGVACPSDGHCVVVGTYEASAGPEGLLLDQNTQGWIAEEGLLPAGASTEGVGAISCWAAGDCAAVGSSVSQASSEDLVFLNETAGAWSLGSAVSSPQAGDYLDTVDCPGAGECVAGGVSGRGATTGGLLVEEAQSGWTIVAGRQTPGTAVYQVACRGSGACVAIGALGELLAEGPNGWGSVQPPLPPGAQNVDLEAVSCAPGTNCLAVGSESDRAGNEQFGDQPLAIEYVDGTWELASPALPAGFGTSGPTSFLDAVSCIAAGPCTAVGPYPVAPSGSGVFADLTTVLSPSVADAQFQGSTGGLVIDKPVVGMAVDPATGGYWLVASDGGVFAYDAPFYGSVGGTHLDAPIVGIASAPDGNGYYLVASDGGVFAFGPGATFQGSTGGQALNKPVVGMAVDPETNGYWLVASDGGVFSFDAPFYGSTGGVALTEPVVGIAPAPYTGGYWLDASDGGIFAFHAPFEGSMGGTRLDRPVVGMAADVGTGGYWLVASDGGIFSFNAPFYGSAGGVRLRRPVVGIGVAPDSSGYYDVAADGGIFTY